MRKTNDLEKCNSTKERRHIIAISAKSVLEVNLAGISVKLVAILILMTMWLSALSAVILLSSRVTVLLSFLASGKVLVKSNMHQPEISTSFFSG